MGVDCSPSSRQGDWRRHEILADGPRRTFRALDEENHASLIVRCRPDFIYTAIVERQTQRYVRVQRYGGNVTDASVDG